MNQEQGHIDNKVKNALENYEVAYDPLDWLEMEDRLDALDRQKKNKLRKTAAAILLLALLGGGSGFYIYQNTKNTTQEKQQITTTQVNEKETANDRVKKSIDTEAPKSEGSTEAIRKNKEQHNQAAPVAPEKTENARKETAEKTKKAAPSGEVRTSKPQKQEATTDKKPSETQDNTAEKTPAPIAGFTADMHAACALETIHFEAEESEVPVAYFWDFGDGNTSENPNPRHIYKDPGVYSVTLKVQSLLDDREVQKTVENMITIHPAPTADFEWEEESEPNNPPYVRFVNRSKASTYIWNFGNDQLNKEIDPRQHFKKKGSYPVRLIAINNYGCSDTTAKTVEIESTFNLNAPKAFSPDGNDLFETWLPLYLLDNDVEFTLNIYEPSTKNQVFSTNDKFKPWDGRLLGTSNKAQPGERYVWIARVKFQDGTVGSYGDIITVGSDRR